MKIAFPDTLTWQAGLEFGLEAVSRLNANGSKPRVSFVDSGPMLEAISFALLDFGLLNSVVWVRDQDSTLFEADIALFPRVTAGDRQSIEKALARGVRTFSSDPDFTSANPLYTSFVRRDVEALKQLMEGFIRSR